MLEFSWDSRKDVLNKKKHGLGFEEASSCFFDPMHILIDDPDYSSEEDDRCILIGLSFGSKLLVVVHAEKSENLIRIISARKCTKKERQQYEEV